MYKMPIYKAESARPKSKGIVRDVDAGGILSQPYTIGQTTGRIAIPKDVYATRPFYFGGSNIRFFKNVK